MLVGRQITAAHLEPLVMVCYPSVDPLLGRHPVPPELALVFLVVGLLVLLCEWLACQKPPR